MTVYIDDANIPYGRMIMCHMIATTDDELHKMAEHIGIKRKWFQDHGDHHYDICQSKKQRALNAGAIEISKRDLVRIIIKNRDKTDG